MKRHCLTSYPFFALIGLILLPLAVVHASPPPNFEQRERDYIRPAAKRLAPLAVGHASSTNNVVVADRFGREVNGTGITLVDWEGYIANPAMKYTVKAPSDTTVTRVILSSSEPRLHFNLPSWSGVEGSRKELDFSGTSSQVEFYISIFPDRDGLDEVHSLTIEYLDLNGNWHTQTIDVHVIDQDVSSRALDFDITLDFSQDQTVLFNDSVVRQTVQQAADDWAHFIDDMDLDQVASGQEESWIWDSRGYSHGSKPIRNKMSYTGFLLYAYGVRDGSGGQPSYGSYQSSNGVRLPLRRSGNTSIDTRGNYNTLGWMTSLPDEEWWKGTNFGDVQNDLYSIVFHEIGHALVFNPGYDELDKFKELGYVKDPTVKNYYDSYPAIDRFDHLPKTIDPVSRRGAYGNEYGGEMPPGRWLITKGHLLVAQAIGYTLRETSPFTPLSIAATPSEGTLGASYSYTASVSGGTPAYYWSIESGTLPEGLSIDSFTGTISGTPRQHGTFNFTISVSDYDETTSSVTRTLTLTIREGETEPLADSEPSSEDQQGSEETPTTAVELEGISTSHDLVRENDGQTTTITLTATLDKAAATDETITLALVFPTQGQTAKRGEDFDATFPETFTIAKGQRVGTAQLTLTPKDNETADGDKAFGVQATSSSGHKALINIKIADDEMDDGEDGELDDEELDDDEEDDGEMAFAFAGEVVDQAYTAGTAISALVLPEATGGEGEITYRVSGLPAGLSFDDPTRTTSGTPEAATDGAVEITYLAQDSAGAVLTLTFSITVNPSLNFGDFFDLLGAGEG